MAPMSAVGPPVPPPEPTDRNRLIAIKIVPAGAETTGSVMSPETAALRIRVLGAKLQKIAQIENAGVGGDSEALSCEVAEPRRQTTSTRGTS
jgi:hypothetical protein